MSIDDIGGGSVVVLRDDDDGVSIKALIIDKIYESAIMGVVTTQLGQLRELERSYFLSTKDSKTDGEPNPFYETIQHRIKVYDGIWNLMDEYRKTPDSFEGVEEIVQEDVMEELEGGE